MQSIRLPGEPGSVARARAFVREVAGDHERAPEAVLLTSELVANVVLHARTDVTLRAAVGPPLRVEVRDGAATTNAFRALVAHRPARVADTSPGGRGLRILHTLATRIGLTENPTGGKVVWFEL